MRVTEEMLQAMATRAGHARGRAVEAELAGVHAESRACDILERAIVPREVALNRTSEVSDVG